MRRKKNPFNLSHYHPLTCDMGELIPLTWYEVLPGDTFKHSTAALLRCRALLAPVMHPVHVRIHHWFVPYAEIWEDWEDFITGGQDGLDASVHPYIDGEAVTEGDLLDHLGYPVSASSMAINALPVRAYNFIVNNRYRDQDLVTERVIDLTDGQDTTTDTSLFNVAWEKDMYTTLRTFSQRGTEVNVPISGEAPVSGIGAAYQTYPHASQSVYESDGTNPTYANASFVGINTEDDFYVEEDPSNSGYPNIVAQLASATGVPISDFRLSIKTQRFMERLARSGARYSEFLKSLGVNPKDFRLHEPQYLGGARQTIQFSEVVASSVNSADSQALGDLGGHGIAAVRSNRFYKYFLEHGLVMTLMSVVPKAVYTQSVHKKWLRSDKFDYYTPELDNLSWQPTLDCEIYEDAASTTSVFGYGPAYESFRSHPSYISGEFLTTENHWHYGRILGAEPSLDGTFVTCTPTKRVNANDTDHCLYVLANHNIRARRAMSMTGQPTSI